jgi:quercetin dioxygenase-like cupin family protein
MASIFQVDEKDVPWVEYRGSDSIRFKALSHLGTDVPSMQYVEYAPGYVDPVHSHDTGEWLIVTAGELRMDDGKPASGQGSAVYVPKDTPYAIHSGGEGVRFFRIVAP